MARNKDTASTVDADSPTMTVQEAVKQFGPDFMRELIEQLTPVIRRAVGGNVRKQYEVEPFTGTRTVEEYVRAPLIDSDGNHVVDSNGKKRYKFEKTSREVTGGYMVYLPQGHSIFVESAERLKEMNLDAPSGLVDMATGLPAMEAENSIKDLVQRNTTRTPQRRSGDGSLAGSLDAVIDSTE